MENNFIIEIEIGREKLIFDARLDTIGFVHRVLINVSGIDVIFEPDEERNYRAIIHSNSVNKITDADKQIIIFLGEKLESLKGELENGGPSGPLA